MSPPRRVPGQELLARRYGPASGRRSNLGHLLGHLHRHGPKARSDLVGETGLGKAAVTALVNDLLEWGLLSEQEVTHTGQSGRPSRPLALDGRWIEGIGVELGEHEALGMVTNLAGEVVSRATAPLGRRDGGDDPTAVEVEPAVARLATQLIDGALDRGHVVAGVCLAVPVHLCRPHPASVARAGWHPAVTDAAEGLTRLVAGRCGPVAGVRTERSAVLAAAAEHRLGGHDAAATLVTVDGGVAIDGGAVLDGAPAPAVAGLLGDLGHLVVAPDGERCRCGRRGCWETVVGVEAIVRQCCPELAGNPLALRSPTVVAQVADRAGRGDPVALDGLDHIGNRLGHGLDAIVAMLDPDTIVLDGTFRLLAPWLLDTTRTAAAARRSGPTQPGLTVAASSVDSAACRGAAIRAVEPVVDDPVPILAAVRS